MEGRATVNVGWEEGALCRKRQKNVACSHDRVHDNNKAVDLVVASAGDNVSEERGRIHCFSRVVPLLAGSDPPWWPSPSGEMGN